MDARDRRKIIGHWRDPIRQQGRDPLYDEELATEGEWMPTRQSCDRARNGRRRVYHKTWFTSSGDTYDAWLDSLAATPFARECRDAGVDLGLGNTFWITTEREVR